MKYCLKKIPLYLLWIILFGSISLFGQDPDAAWNRSITAAAESPSSPEIVKLQSKLSQPIVTIPKNLLPHLAITNAEIAEFQKLLSEKDTGIFKLWNDICGDLKIIDASKDGDCLEYSDFALGSQYSLDLQKYSNINSNFLLSKNRFSVTEKSRQSSQILMDLGKREFSEINKKTKEVIELSKIKMVDRYSEFQMNKILERDEIKNNRISLSYPAVSDHIFLLRSVFFDNPQNFTWQRETIYAFQMVRLKNNIATIIWKKITSKWV